MKVAVTPEVLGAYAARNDGPQSFTTRTQMSPGQQTWDFGVSPPRAGAVVSVRVEGPNGWWTPAWHWNGSHIQIDSPLEPNMRITVSWEQRSA